MVCYVKYIFVSLLVEKLHGCWVFSIRKESAHVPLSVVTVALSAVTVVLSVVTVVPSAVTFALSVVTVPLSVVTVVLSVVTVALSAVTDPQPQRQAHELDAQRPLDSGGLS